ncbi:MAG: hypothetical protein ABI862_06395 [Ilumatobacteraceae bacterium]
MPVPSPKIIEVVAEPVPETVPETATAPEVVDIAEDATEVELLDDEFDVDESDMDVEVAAGAAAESPIPVAQPEVNRLALVPDLVDDDSPIELPAITPSGPVVAHVPSVYVQRQPWYRSTAIRSRFGRVIQALR